MASCPHCRADLEGDSPNFCASCGAALREEREPEEGAAAAVVPAGPEEEEILFEGRPAVLTSAGELLFAILTLGIALPFFWLRSLGRLYKVTTQRIVVEHGVLDKRLEQIDLSRVVDYVVERPFGQRLMGTGNVVLHAADKSTPEIRIGGIRTDVLALYEELRAATEAERRRRGVRVLDVE